MKKLLRIFLVLCIFTSLLPIHNKTALVASAASEFVHPGILHTQADFDRMKQMVEAGQQPYLDGWNQLVNSTYSQAGWTPRATATIIRGGSGDNVSLLYNDIARAYQCALRWKISGSTAHGDTARNILNAWSSTLTTISGNADRYLAAGLFGYQMANAAEIMRGYPGFNVEQMKNMLLNVFYKPLNERFLIGNEYGSDHNDAYITNYWANWDLCNMAATVAIGIFCDRRDIYEIGIEYFKNGAGNGSIFNAIPYKYTNGLAQWQESGRDQGHSNLGIGLMACVCEMAWNQGDDLYGWADNRFMYAAEYVARYNNGNDVPFTTYEWGTGQSGTYQSQTTISANGRGEMRPIWEMIYNHYANRKGLSVPNIADRAAAHRPEGGPGGHATTFDQPGFGTLTYTRPPGGGSSATLPPGNIPDGTYRIVSRHSGKAMQASGTSSNSKIVQSPVSSSTAQQWNITHLGGGLYRITNAASGLVLDITGRSMDNGADAILWSYNGGDNQKFAFIPTSDGYYRITPSHSTKPLEITDASTADEAIIQQYRYWLHNWQQWKLEPVGGGSTNVVRLQSHNYPDRYVRHSDYRARIDSNVSPAQDAHFKMVPGLANSSGVSFESVNFPGYYLRVRSNGEVWLGQNDGSSGFKNDATFRRVAGLADSNKNSYQMWTDSSRYLRHYNYLMRADSGSGDLFKADATYREVSP
jgi:hypothetical protein